MLRVLNRLLRRRIKLVMRVYLTVVATFLLVTFLALDSVSAGIASLFLGAGALSFNFFLDFLLLD